MRRRNRHSTVEDPMGAAHVLRPPRPVRDTGADDRQRVLAQRRARSDQPGRATGTGPEPERRTLPDGVLTAVLAAARRGLGRGPVATDAEALGPTESGAAMVVSSAAPTRIQRAPAMAGTAA